MKKASTLIIRFRCQVIRDEKREEIERLQHEIAELRAAQVHEIAQRKAEFDKEVQKQREEDDAALEKIQREADQVGAKTILIRPNHVQVRRLGGRSIHLRSIGEHSRGEFGIEKIVERSSSSNAPVKYRERTSRSRTNSIDQSTETRRRSKTHSFEQSHGSIDVSSAGQISRRSAALKWSSRPSFCAMSSCFHFQLYTWQ